MEQIYIDSLKALMVYKYDLDAVVLELERVEHHNAVLYFVLGAVVVLAAAVGYFIYRRYSRVIINTGIVPVFFYQKRAAVLSDMIPPK